MAASSPTRMQLLLSKAVYVVPAAFMAGWLAKEQLAAHKVSSASHGWPTPMSRR